MSGDRTRLNRREALELLGFAAGIAALRQPLSAAARFEPPAPQAARIPGNAIVRTVLKDISPDDLRGGTTLMHEHVTGGFYSSPPRQGRGGQGGEDIDLIVDELTSSKKDGLVGIVDASFGRRKTAKNIEDLKTISTRSGVHIIAAGGYFHAPFPAELMAKSDDQIIDEYVSDAKAQRWGAFGEIGTSMEMHADERRMLRILALGHQRTGIPIFTHTPHEGCGKCALEQLDFFEAEKVDPRHLCIGHLSDLHDDPKALVPIAIAKRGAWIGFDTVGHELNVSKTTLVTDRMKLQRVLAIIEAGLEDYLLLSADLAHNNHLKANWGEGFSTVQKSFAGKMRNAGVKEPTISKILHDNPRRFLAFTPKAS